MKRSPLSTRIVVLVDLDLSAPSFRCLLLEGVCPVKELVPVKAQSDTPSSRCLGDLLAFAMLDLGESRNVFEVERAKHDGFVAYGCEGWRVASAFCRGGVKGEEWFETLVARLVVRVRGEGVRGMRPPAVRVEKMP